MSDFEFLSTLEPATFAAHLRLAGELDGFATPDLPAQVETMPSWISSVCVDMAGVTFIDAGGVGKLVMLHRAAGGRGATIAFVDVAACVRWVCTLAGVTDLLGITPLRSAPDVVRPRVGSTPRSDPWAKALRAELVGP